MWDVGANVGLFSFASAQLARPEGRVTAIEAGIVLPDLIRRSARLQPDSIARTTVIPVAISDALAVVELNIAERGQSMNHLASTTSGYQSGGFREQVNVMSVTLDWLLHQTPAPNLVKVDIEGAEAVVLRGGGRSGC